MKKKTAGIFAAVLVLLILGALLAWKCLAPEAGAGEKTVTVNVHHLAGEVKSFTVKTDSEFVRGALEPEGIIAGPDESYGMWVTTVDGETADESLQQWWGYDVNGETAMYGVDSQPINDGDVIDFILNEGY